MEAISENDLLELRATKLTRGFRGYPQKESPAASPSTSSASSVDADSRSSSSDSDKIIYPGDIEDEDTLADNELKTLDFPNSAILLAYFDKHFLEGKVSLHPWQVEVSEELAAAKATSLHPHKFCLCAANGSGKDAFVIAPFCIWFALTKRKSLTIVTSSSGVQLAAQTENYIRSLAEKVNEKLGQEVFKIRQRFIKCLLSGSEIRLFATDEAGKAEGYHPLEPDAEMAIIVNEGKSVNEEIHGALKRCTGFNYWLEVSTPGEPFGYFHRVFTDVRLRFKTRRVTAYDCPHISHDEIEGDRIELGEHSALFRSMRLALFTSLGGNAVIPQELIDQILVNPPKLVVGSSWPVRVGIDLAAGGDENSIHAFKGNKLKLARHWRETDTTITADQIDQILKKELKLPYDYEEIYIDDGGIGHSITDMLVRKGWINIKRILNQSAAKRKKQYGNKGAEMWSTFKRIVEERFIDLSQLDERTRVQIANRYYKQASQGRIFLESKKEAKADGRPSPDRGDSLILCFSGLSIDDFIEATTEKEVKPTVKLKTHDELQKWMEDQQFAESGPRLPAHGSLNVIMNRHKNNPLKAYGYNN